MDFSFEAQVVQTLEQALAEPPADRLAWLAGRDLPAAVRVRVQELLAGERDMTGFLEGGMPADAVAAALAGLPSPGDRVGAWRLLHALDAGGMGIVYLADRADGTYEQRAAIKFIRTDHLLDAHSREAIVERFENERRMLARLDHPNVARILDGGSTGGLPYLVMEYVDGVALDRWCDEHALGVDDRIALFAKVCDGVQAVHRHLIVHRDLKPRNILVGADGVPRLLDFGIARVLDAGAQATATATAAPAMTPAYASPEQMRLEPLTTASDVYSLGVVLYELLAGARPYSLDGLSPAQSERIVCDSQPITLRRALAGGALPDAERRIRLASIRGDLERIVAKALHKDPVRRYDSAQALGDDLRRCLDGRPVTAHPDSTGYRLARFVRRHRVGSAVAALALLAILGAVAVALVQARAARRAAADMGLVNAFLLDVLQTSNPYETGTEMTLAAALDDAVGKVDERFGDRPDLAADIRNALGESLHARYRLDAAETQLVQARADAERAFGPDDRRAIRAIAALANVRKEQDRDAEAQALFDEALRRLERSGQTSLRLHADILNDVGVFHIVQEDFAQARDYLERAVAADPGGGSRDDAEQRARTLASLAQAERGLGHLDRAEALYAQAQPILEAAYPDGGPHLAVLLNNRSRLKWARGDHEGALELQKRAVAMHRRSFNGDHVMILVPMTNLAREAVESGKVDLAAEWAEQADAMAGRLYPQGSHPYQVYAVTVLAATRLAQGRVDEAVAQLARVKALLAGLDSVPKSTRDYVAKVGAQVCASAVARGATACADVSPAS